MRRHRLVLSVLILALLVGVQPAVAAPHRQTAPAPYPSTLSSIQTVFIILMENHNWVDFPSNPSAPYINSLLPSAAHAENYHNPTNLHPSLPNYLWLEAGTNFGVTDDFPPSVHHQSTTLHLTTFLSNAGISWKAYEEDTVGNTCPLTDINKYATRHDPVVYFDDVTDTNSPSSATCIAHVRPYTELATDLTNQTVARYNFITPNVCDDMHDSTGCATSDSIKNGDTWLSQQVPLILNSAAYQNNGALFITWDESELSLLPNPTIGMIVLSLLAKAGYSNTIGYTHNSTLQTFQEIFGVAPMLGDAANAADLGDLFRPLKPVGPSNPPPIPPSPPIRPPDGPTVGGPPSPLPPTR
jgi:hypothetical protein